VSLTLQASPQQGEPPLSTTITWTTNNATVAAISGPGLNSTALNGSQALTLQEGNHSFTLTASNDGSNDQQVLIVSVQRAPVNLQLSVSDPAGGSVTGSGTYLRGDIARPVVTVAPMWYFAGWTGDITGTSLSPSVLMDTSKNATATLAPKTKDVIAFTNPGDQLIRPIGTPRNILLVAGSQSGLPVGFQVLSGPASVSGAVLTMDGQLGTIVLQATQPIETATRLPADPVVVTFEVKLMPPSETKTETESAIQRVDKSTAGKGYILAPKK
jgi:hypothetical protein